jgi:hypothetical protein
LNLKSLEVEKQQLKSYIDDIFRAFENERKKWSAERESLIELIKNSGLELKDSTLSSSTLNDVELEVIVANFIKSEANKPIIRNLSSPFSSSSSLLRPDSTSECDEEKKEKVPKDEEKRTEENKEKKGNKDEREAVEVEIEMEENDEEEEERKDYDEETEDIGRGRKFTIFAKEPPTLSDLKQLIISSSLETETPVTEPLLREQELEQKLESQSLTSSRTSSSSSLSPTNSDSSLFFVLSSSSAETLTASSEIVHPPQASPSLTPTEEVRETPGIGEAVVIRVRREECKPAPLSPPSSTLSSSPNELEEDFAS